MRKASVGALCALSALLCAGSSARAQDKPAATAPGQQPLVLHREQFGGVDQLSVVGRTRMRNGDCPGALDAFDEALRTAVDPTLRRDRGLCHERLGHPYPAIDDYRAYLRDMPDAPDADGIRDRLRRLEEETTGQQRARNPNEEELDRLSGADAAKTSPANLAYVDRGEEEDPMRSPLRRGRGLSLGPWFGLHKWIVDTPLSTWSESVGLGLRYSMGGAGSLLLEAGYEHFNGTNIDPGVVSGFTSQIAYELRLPMTSDWDDQLILAPGVGFVQLYDQPSNPSADQTSGGALGIRGRFGWRHMVQNSTGIDLSIDAGIPNLATSGTFVFESQTTVLVAANVGIAWGL